jgi:hypothetical protein
MSRGLWIAPACLTGIGIGLLSWTLFQALEDLVARLTRRRLWHLRPQTKTLSTEEELFDIPPLGPYTAGATLVGLWFGWMLFTGPTRFLGGLAGILPLLWKRQRIRSGRQEIRQEVFDLVETLRLYVTFAQTPGAALLLAIDEMREGILWSHLRRQRDTIIIAGPEEALAHVAGELQSPALKHFLSRIRAAQAGSGGISVALRSAAEEVRGDLHRELEELVEGAPTRFLIPMLVFLLPPLLAIVLGPPVQAFLDSLAGVGPGTLPGR